jgi:hypothetical protein
MNFVPTRDLMRVRSVAAVAVRAVLADSVPGSWELLRIVPEPAAGVPERVCVIDPSLTRLGWPAFGPTLLTALTRQDLLTLLISAWAVIELFLMRKAAVRAFVIALIMNMGLTAFHLIATNWKEAAGSSGLVTVVVSHRIRDEDIWRDAGYGDE